MPLLFDSSDGGAWPFWVGGLPFLVNSGNERAPTRLGVYNAKAFKRIQVGSYTYMSEDWD